MNTTNNQSIQQINTAALRGTREAHQPDEDRTYLEWAIGATERLHKKGVFSDLEHGHMMDFYRRKL